MVDQSPATALLNKGDYRQWKNAAGVGPTKTDQIDGIGTTMFANSWPIQPGWDKTQATTSIYVYRNPYGDIWDSPGRFPGIKEWAKQYSADALTQFQYDLDAARRPVKLPWGPTFKGAAGTTDNGVLVDTAQDGSRGYEVQSLTQITNIFDVWAINNRGMYWLIAPDASRGHRPAQLGDYRVDAMGYRAPETLATFIGPEGPEPMHDHLLRPSDLAGPWKTYKQLVGLNINFGPGAVAAPGGWVEHKSSAQPSPNTPMPTGAQPGIMMPCYQSFKLDISDSQIEAWLVSTGATGVLKESKRWYARGWRDQGVRVMMTGSGMPIISSTGQNVASEKADWIARGIIDDNTAQHLGTGLFKFGTLVAL